MNKRKGGGTLRGDKWRQYLHDHLPEDVKQEEIYVCTHNYVPIYKVGDYYFSFQRPIGYRNLTSLKRLLI